MATKFELPDLGENIEAGDVIKILVSVGDTIAKKQTVLELETDKAVVEVPSSVAGVVEKIHVKEGEKASVGQLILTVSDGAGAQESAKAEPAKEETKEEAKEEETAKPEQAREEEPPQEKEPRESPSPRPEPAPAAQPSGGEVVDFRAARERDERTPIPASPSVRRFAREIGVEISQVKGTGSQGRISREDVKAHARSRAGGAVASEGAAAPAAAPLPDFTRWGEVRREKFSNVRRKTAEHMARCWLTVPHVTQNDECDVTGLEERRKRYASRVEKEGGKLTVTGIAVKVLAGALKVFPQFNASIDVAGEEIVHKEYVNIGVAVDTPRGLLVPVLREVDRKNIVQLSVELQELAGKAREGKVSPEMLQGGTFTVTNLGGIGGTSFSPIVNWPEVAILGISRGKVQPVHRDGEFVPRMILPLSLSYDHRLIDGADAARFLRWVCSALEDPFLLALEG